MVRGRRLPLNLTHMVIDYKFWAHVIFWGKVTGAVATFGGVIGFLHKTLISPVFKRVKAINETVTQLATNHLPHIQTSLNAQDVVLEELKSDVAKGTQKIQHFGEGLNETKDTVAMLHEALLTHLQKTSEEVPRKKHHAVRESSTAGLGARPSRGVR